ncbi:MAG: hypothetical protein HRT47_09380 [Candidatus Caenarcaniphilales bacterium]|nr:hypothetical protein [Candidatus Caenarcaniphilales bacterium]
MKILFICTGNVFRSMIAEKCLKDYLRREGINGVEVDSAGTAPIVQNLLTEVVDRLDFYQIESNSHQYKKVTEKLLKENDFVIPMSTDHQEYLLDEFAYKAELFNKLAHDKDEGILDFHEYNTAVDSFENPKYKEFIESYANDMVDYIYKSIPKLFGNLRKISKPSN